MEKIFQDRVALVTGGSYGIGQATAVAFAQRGANVVIADWKEDEERTTINRIKAEGSEAIFVQCDVAKGSDVQHLMGTIINIFGRLDYAFNNAGIEGMMAPTHECTEENWDKTMDINVKGVWLCMKQEILQMRQQGKGAIVNCASVAGLNGFANLPAYVVSKKLSRAFEEIDDELFRKIRGLKL